MRRVISFAVATMVLALGSPAWSESPALKAAKQETQTFIKAGKYAEAVAPAKKAVDLAKQEFGADSAEFANNAYWLTSLYVARGRYVDAEPLAKRLLEIYQKAFGPDHLKVASRFAELADIYRGEARYAEAEPLYQRAAAITKKAGGQNNPEFIRIINSLATLYQDEGRYFEAEALFKQALAIAEISPGQNTLTRFGDLPTQLNNLGFLYLNAGRYADAEPLFKRAIDLFEKTAGRDHPEVGTALDNLAQLYVRQGRFVDAEPLMERSLAIREKALGPDHVKVGWSLSNKGYLYREEGRYAESVPLFRRALAIQEKTVGVSHPDYASVLNNLATVYQAEGHDAEAVALYERAMAIRERALGTDHPNFAKSLENLGTLYRNQNRYVEAETLYKRSLAVREKALGPDNPDIAVGLDNLAELYIRQRRYSEALPFVRRAVSIQAARASSDSELSKGQQSELRRKRVVFIDEVQVTAHLATTNDPQTASFREEGFAALQWSKASDAAAAVAHMAARFASGSDALALAVRQRQDIKNQLEAIDKALLAAVSKIPEQRDPSADGRLRKQGNELRAKLKTFDAELAQKFPAYTELSSPRPLTIGETQRLLGPGQALLAFALGEDESYLAVLTPSAYAVHILAIGAREISAAIKALRQTLQFAGASGFSFDATVAYNLYNQLIAPAESDLQGISQLYVVTDGALDSLPLGVLLTAAPETSTFSNLDAFRRAPWLARRYALSVLPSVSSLKAFRQFTRGSAAPHPFMGIGDPLLKDHPPPEGQGRGVSTLAFGSAVPVKAVFRGTSVDVVALRNLPSLPETAGELEAEAKLFGANDNALLLRATATVTAVKRADLSKQRIIAFATHGLLAGDVGIAEPGLVLTPPIEPTREDDGLLKASDIARVKLDADLVILSACNTAASDGTPGAEGFSGLSKAFLYAGARSLLVSHWEVVSDSTVELMTRVAAHLKEESVDHQQTLRFAEALRRAELDLINNPTHPEYAHPLFWAPFVVVGKGG